MRVLLDGGAVLDLGVTEAAPTIKLIDYSRRDTDDFGVTTVVPRAFARQMSVRVQLPTDQVDAVQRQLAALRAKPAQWIADERYESLAFRGFFKEFAFDLAMPPVSFFTLTVEGLAEEGGFVDPGTDPAPDGRTSTLRLLQPAAIEGAALVSSTVPENDYPAWSAGASYALGARVILASTHRIYESATAANVGHDPAGTSGLWIDIGPTNRWAMFDQALGSLTEANGPITVVLDPASPVRAVALLDVTAATVRVQASGYDRTAAPSGAPGMVTFLDLPPTSGAITVTITGGAVSVGTLLAGDIVGLGITESSPTAGITDYSRKETDDFGEVEIVERAWAKRMTARGLIDTAAIDIVAGRVASARAKPSLWIGDDALESITVYGFFKDFSIEVGDVVSTIALSIEGLSAAAKIAPIVTVPDVGWNDIKDDDPAHPKPQDGADKTEDAWTGLTGRTPQQVIDSVNQNMLNIAAEMLIAGTYRAETDEIIYTAGGDPVRTAVQQLGVLTNQMRLYVTSLQEVNAADGTAKFVLSANANGDFVGIEGFAGQKRDQITFVAPRLQIVDPNGGNPRVPFSYEGNLVVMPNVRINTLEVGSVTTGGIALHAVADGDSIALASPRTGNSTWQTAVTYTLTVPPPVAGEVVDWQVMAIVTGSQGFPSGDRTWNTRLLFDGAQKGAAGGEKSEDSLAMSGRVNWGPGTYVIKVDWNGQSGVTLSEMNMTLLWFKR